MSIGAVARMSLARWLSASSPPCNRQVDARRTALATDGKFSGRNNPMLQDRYGNLSTTSSPAARDAYVVGVDRLLGADAKIEDAFRAAIPADDGFALAHIALTRASQVLGHGAEIKAPLERALALTVGTSERERSHIAIFAKILTGQGAAAIPLVLKHTRIWPRDAMVMAPITSAFGLIGFSGQTGREARQLAVLQPHASAYVDDWWFRTVFAFAQIELQDFTNGLRNIKTALRGNPRNGHANAFRKYQERFFVRGKAE